MVLDVLRCASILTKCRVASVMSLKVFHVLPGQSEVEVIIKAMMALAVYGAGATMIH